MEREEATSPPEPTYRATSQPNRPMGSIRPEGGLPSHRAEKSDRQRAHSRSLQACTDQASRDVRVAESLAIHLTFEAVGFCKASEPEAYPSNIGDHCHGKVPPCGSLQKTGRRSV